MYFKKWRIESSSFVLTLFFLVPGHSSIASKQAPLCTLYSQAKKDKKKTMKDNENAIEG